MVLAGEAVVADQVLEDALRRQAGFELGEDDLPPRLAQAGLPTFGSGAREPMGASSGVACFER